MQLGLLFSILFILVPNLANATLAELMSASDEESQREQRELAQIGPEQEEQIESELLEEVSQTVGPMHVEEAELKEPKGVAGLCRKLSQKFDCEKAKRSKETCVEAKALLEEMALGLSSSSPAEMNEKIVAYLRELLQIVQKQNKNKKKKKTGDILRRKRRGFKSNCKIAAEALRGTLVEMWGEWWLKTEIKHAIRVQAKNKADNWKWGRFAKFTRKLLSSIFGAAFVAIFEFPVKILMTLALLALAISLAISG